MLGQLLHRQRRPRIAKVSGIEVKDPSSERGRLPLVRGLASSPIREPLFTFGLQAVAEPSNVTRREPSCLNGLLLRQLLARTWRATWTRRSSLPFMTMLSSPTISSSLREPDSLQWTFYCGETGYYHGGITLGLIAAMSRTWILLAHWFIPRPPVCLANSTDSPR